MSFVHRLYSWLHYAQLCQLFLHSLYLCMQLALTYVSLETVFNLSSMRSDILCKFLLACGYFPLLCETEDPLGGGTTSHQPSPALACTLSCGEELTKC